MLNNRFSFLMREGLVASLIFLSLGCSKHDTQANTPKTSEKLLPTTNSIQRQIVNVSCLSCHTQATTKNRNIDLTDISQSIEGEMRATAGHNHSHSIIKPGCPKQSLFLSIMKEGKMPPPPSVKITVEQLNIISDWIVSLNPNAGTSCEGNDEPGGTPEPGEPIDPTEP